MSLSKIESEFLTTFSANGKRVFSFQQAADFFQSKIIATNSLGRLVRNGWLQRLERGIYMVIPLEAGPGRVWSENPFILASNLVSPSAIGYWSALRFWNMTEQIPRRQFIQTTKRKRNISIQGIEYQFVTVTNSHFFGVITRNIDGYPIMVTDREKTIIDAANRPDLSGGIYQVAQALEDEVKAIDFEKLERYLNIWGGGAVVKRLGYLIETLALPIPSRELMLIRWKALISKGVSLLEPGYSSGGTTVTRWHLQINVPITPHRKHIE